jgi:hypothetical protein
MDFPSLAETSAVIDFFGRVPAALGVWVTAAIATVAFLKYRSDRKAQNRSNALQSYGAYLKVAFEYPEFARPDDWEKIKNDRAAYKQYRWFVSIMLLAFEEVINFAPLDKEWRQAIAWQLRYHIPYLREQYFFKGQIKIYEPELQEIIREEVAKSSDSLPRP